MGQILHKTLWCLEHLLILLLSLISECFGIIKCTVSKNGSFFLCTGLGGGGEGKAASSSSSDTSSWTVSSSFGLLQVKRGYLVGKELGSRTSPHVMFLRVPFLPRLSFNKTN